MAEERTLGLARAPEPGRDEFSKEELQRRMEEARESISHTVTEIKETMAHQVETVKEALDWRGHKQTKDWYAVMKSRPCFRPLLAERMEVIVPPGHYDKVDF